MCSEIASTVFISVGSAIASVRLPASSVDTGNTVCLWASSAGTLEIDSSSTTCKTAAPTRGIISLL